MSSTLSPTELGNNTLSSFRPDGGIALRREEIQSRLRRVKGNPIIDYIRRIRHTGREQDIAAAIYNNLPTELWDAIDASDTITDPAEIRDMAYEAGLDILPAEVTDVGFISLPGQNTPLLVQIHKAFHFSQEHPGEFATTKLYRISPLTPKGETRQGKALLLWVFQANMDPEEVLMPRLLPSELFDPARKPEYGSVRNILLLPVNQDTLAA